MSVEDAKKGKQEVWKELHATRTQCPHCSKRLTMRTLRWKHVCKRRPIPPILLDPDLAEERRRELQRKVEDCLRARLALLEGP